MFPENKKKLYDKQNKSALAAGKLMSIIFCHKSGINLCHKSGITNAPHLYHQTA